MSALVSMFAAVGAARGTKFRRVMSVALAVALVLSGGMATLPHPFAAAASTCAVAQAQQASFTLDGVSVAVCTPFLPASTFVATDPSNAIQSASAASLHPYREFSVTAVPFGTIPATEALPVAHAGGADSYRSALRAYRMSQGGTPQPGPVATVFGQQVNGQASIINLDVGEETPSPTVIVEWVVEAGQRLWIVRISAELAPGQASQSQSFIDSLAGITLNSDTLNAPSTSANQGASAIPNAPGVPTTSSVSAPLPFPAWWQGAQCDSSIHAGSYPLVGHLG